MACSCIQVLQLAWDGAEVGYAGVCVQFVQVQWKGTAAEAVWHTEAALIGG
jgi:hypothetical protein